MTHVVLCSPVDIKTIHATKKAWPTNRTFSFKCFTFELVMKPDNGVPSWKLSDILIAGIWAGECRLSLDIEVRKYFIFGTLIVFRIPRLPRVLKIFLCLVSSSLRTICWLILSVLRISLTLLMPLLYFSIKDSPSWARISRPVELRSLNLLIK